MCKKKGFVEFFGFWKCGGFLKKKERASREVARGAKSIYT
jgi:hypothetical protein